MRRVIITQNIKNFYRGDIVEVKPGYAKNFLLPNKYAIYYTLEEAEKLAASTSAIQKEREEYITNIQQVSKKLDGTFIPFIKSVSDGGQFYSSIKVKEINTKLEEMFPEIKDYKLNCKLEKNIKEPGIYIIKIDFNYNVEATAHINAQTSESALTEAEKNYNNQKTRKVNENKKNRNERIEEEINTSNKENGEDWIEQLHSIVKEIEANSIDIIRATENEAFVTPIKSSDIIKIIKEKYPALSNSNIICRLPKPITEPGTYKARIELGHNTTTSIFLNASSLHNENI